MDHTEEEVFSEKHELDDKTLREVLQVFYHWHEKAASPAQQCSRSRVLLVCLVMRFAALRLGEALAYTAVAVLLWTRLRPVYIPKPWRYVVSSCL